MNVSCSQPRIESKPPMKKRRSGYVQKAGGGLFGSVPVHAAVRTFSPRRSSAAKVRPLMKGSGMYPAMVWVSLTKCEYACGAGLRTEESGGTVHPVALVVGRIGAPSGTEFTSSAPR